MPKDKETVKGLEIRWVVRFPGLPGMEQYNAYLGTRRAIETREGRNKGWECLDGAFNANDAMHFLTKGEAEEKLAHVVMLNPEWIGRLWVSEVLRSPATYGVWKPKPEDGQSELVSGDFTPAMSVRKLLNRSDTRGINSPTGSSTGSPRPTPRSVSSRPGKQRKKSVSKS